MQKQIVGRIEKLETSKAPGRVHRIVSETSETHEEAVRRYERETGITVSPEDMVIRRVIISPELYQTRGNA